jgi:hypothetical protein
MQKDSKTVAIWILSIALVVVLGLWIAEMNRPDSVDTFSTALIEKRQAVAVACADVSTDAKRDTCVSALKDVQDLLETIKE